MKKYPAIARAVVLLDVAAADLANIGREPTLYNYGRLFRYGLTYQYLNIFFYWCSRIPGVRYLLRSLPFNYSAAWPYWNLHRDHLVHAMLRLLGYRWLPSWQTSPVQQFPPCPTLFVWGTAKPRSMTFHKPAFVEELEARTDGSRACAMDAGHWVMNDLDMFPDAPEYMKAGILKPGRPDELHAHMDEFLGDMQGKGVLQAPADCQGMQSAL